MRLNRGHALGIATLSGFAIASCNLALGLGGYDFEGAGGSSTTSSGGSSSTSSSSGTGAGGMDGGGPDDAPDGADADAGPEPGRTLWARGFGDEMNDEVVNAVAVGGPSDHVFITGRAPIREVFNCPSSDAGPATTGFLVELDPDDGTCLWSYFFGADAEGTAVAVDGSGNLVLAGTFRSQLSVDPAWPMAAAGTDSFIARFDVGHDLQWVRRVNESGGTGDQKITALSMNAVEIAAAGTYDKALRISGPSITNVDIAGAPDGVDAFVLLFDMNGTYGSILPISSASGMQPQLAAGVGVRATDGTFAVVGSTMGPTKFNGDLVNTGFDSSMFLGVYDSSKTTKFKLILGDGSPQYGRSAAFDHAGHIVIAGDFLGTVNVLGQDSDAGAGIVNEGGADVFVARYQDDGTPGGLLQLGLDVQGTNNATVGGLAIYENATDTTQKHVILAGAFSGTFGVAGGPAVPSAGSNNDVYVARVDFDLAAGKWVKHFGDQADQAATAVAVDSKGNTIVVGRHQGTIDFGSPSLPLENKGGGFDDIFVAKLAP